MSIRDYGLPRAIAFKAKSFFRLECGSCDYRSSSAVAAERALERAGEVEPFLGRQEEADGEPAAVRGEGQQAVAARRGGPVDAPPVGVQPPGPGRPPPPPPPPRGGAGGAPGGLPP